MEQSHEQELTNLRVLQWLHELSADPKETVLAMQDMDQSRIKYISYDSTEGNWVPTDGSLSVPESNLDLLDCGRSTETSMDILVQGVGEGLTHTENLLITKMKLARKTEKLEAEGKTPKNGFYRNFRVIF